MLVLSRKTDQKIIIGSDIMITVVAVNGNRVKIGIQAPENVRILRSELENRGPEAMHSVDSESSYTEPQPACHVEQSLATM